MFKAKVKVLILIFFYILYFPLHTEGFSMDFLSRFSFQRWGGEEKKTCENLYGKICPSK